jgi:hypothetical protein
MNTLAFIASVIGSLAWPATLLIVVFLLLRNGAQLAKFVKAIRFKDFELTLRDDLEKAKTIADGIEARLPGAYAGKEDHEEEDKVLALAKIDPGVGILKSWQKLELALTRLRQHNGLVRFITNVALIPRLLELGKITKSDADLFNQLRSIRNAVVHTGSDKQTISVAEVVEYDQIVETLIRRLDQIQAAPGYIDPK